MILAIFPVDWQLHDSYFVVAHFHYVLFGGAVFGIFAGLYYWFPKMSGRMMSEGLGKVSFWLMFIGFNLTFLIQHSAGLSGMPRRVYDYPEGAGWTEYNLVSTIGSCILGIGVVLTCINVLWAIKHGRKAGNDPWKGNTLEWFVQSPPPENNFDVVPARPLGRADEGHPARGPAGVGAGRLGRAAGGVGHMTAPSQGFRRLALADGRRHLRCW